MATTSRGYPYPDLDTDQPNGPAQIQALAQAVNDDLDAQFEPSYTPISGLTAGANAGRPAPQYVKWADGHVELVGEVTATSSFATGGVLMFTLPAGVRPPAAQAPQSFPVAWSGSTATQIPIVQVAASGAVTLFCIAGVTAVDLSAIRFRTN